MNSRRLLWAVVALVCGASPAWAERVLVKCERPCAAAIAAVERAGGQVTYRYKYVGAIAAEVPSEGLAAVRAVAGAGAVRKDLTVDQPTVARDRDGSQLLAEGAAESAVPFDWAAAATRDASPAGYLINNTNLNLSSVHAAGYLGQGMKVAIIDSGIRPGFPHITLDGSVVGGEDFVNDGRGYSNSSNGGHGTFVAGMISANVTFSFSSSSGLLAAAKAYCPACVTGVNQIPMIGSAPLSSLYALRVFGPTGGAPESRIIAAMERVLELRENYDKGMPETKDASGKYQALNITVCNMSLGGSTLYAGRDLEDELTNAFLEKDIVLVTSAGNAGPSGITVGSPGTGFGSLTVGASSTAAHERILRGLQFGVAAGALYRPFGGTQMAYFSSRGPSADGRPEIEVVANGFASYGQGMGAATTSISLASGTSFSSPTVAGVAAVLRQGVPSATARQVRNAIIASANPGLLDDGSGVLDRGAGHVDAAAALSLLQAGASDQAGRAGGTNVNVPVNLMQGAGVTTLTGNVTLSATGLLPGQRFDTFYRVNPNTAAVAVIVSGVRPGATQNALFGDDIILSVHSAKTSAIGEGDYAVFEFTTGGTFFVPNPEVGVMRVTLSGDWTNASPIDATVQIVAMADPVPLISGQGKLLDGDLVAVPFTVPAGASLLDLRLVWQGDWASYPANDVDLILVDPDGGAHLDGATLNNPETAMVENPKPGNWVALVDGFSVSTKNGDRYQLRISVDGIVLK